MSTSKSSNNATDEAGQPYFVHYMKMREMCLKSHKNAFSATGNPVIDAENSLEKNFMDVTVSSNAGNPEDIIELGLRLYAGCKMPKDVSGALRCFQRLVVKGNPEYVPNVSRSLRARAYSCLCYVNYEEREQSAGTMELDCLYRSGLYADKCAALGLITPIIHSVASTIQSQGLRKREAKTPSGVDVDRFAKLDNLWEAWDKYQAAYINKMQKRGEKLDKQPNSYRCAAEGCGIEATKKSGLMCCAGRCPVEVKPSYCSKQCQVKDWKRHKPICTGKGKAVDEANTTSSSAPAGDGTQSVPVAGNLRSDGRELAIEIANPVGGQPISVSTKTMSPELLRDFGFHVRKLLREHTQ